MNLFKALLVYCVGFGSLLFVSSVDAANHEVRLVGRKSVTVNSAVIKVGDVADVTSSVAGNDDIIIALKKIQIAQSPKPGKDTTLAAASILNTLKSNGVDLKSIGYRLPRVIKVQRAGRKLLEQELRAVIESILSKSDRDIDLRSLEFESDLAVWPGEIELKASEFQTKKPGKLGFSFEALGSEEEVQRFDVFASVEEWREIPVASKSIRRGDVIDYPDVRMARFNVSELPNDVALEPKAIYGLEAGKNISFGEVFRKSKLAIPPVIEMGSAVTLVYRTGGLEATATGVAIESGAINDEIRVRNDSSRKIILGKVLETGLVGVSK